MGVAVIGSGPAGYFCARALIDRGLEVTLLDAGETLGTARASIVERLSATPREHWDRADLAVITATRSGPLWRVPRKLAFGSDYVYGRGRAHSPLVAPAGGPQPTFAKGGYSTVWGAAVLPAADEDLSGWPFGRAVLVPYYERVLREVPLSGADDALAAHFPIHRSGVTEVDPGPQGRAFLAGLRAAERRLEGAGVTAGRARLAVAGSGPARGDCTSCGLCLSGCPFGAIYATAPALDRIARAGRLRYQGQTIVREVIEDASGVTVQACDSSSGRAHEPQRFERVFLGAGAIGSTRIVMQSLRMYEQAVTLLDSQKFLLPFLLARPPVGDLDGQHSVLAAAFLELRDPARSPHWVHIQVSPLNPLVLGHLARALPEGVLRALRPRLARLMIGWGGLHSAHSGRIEASLAAAVPVPILRLRSSRSSDARRTAAHAARRLKRLAPDLGARVLSSCLVLDAVGGGGHVGGSLPMAANPRHRLQSDRLGRLPPWRRIHVVDAAIFPSLPATTLALTIMANAYRIGAETPLD
ncbi:MAG: hypothetical protein FJX56_07335 [Alphaproteobacteria bacterium]|nr:hypothetical protein [Alphaproteobacteria bacterium]